jgi:hypothetical protein
MTTRRIPRLMQVRRRGTKSSRDNPRQARTGMVVSYSFLWKREQEKGETSGRKDRPAAIVVIRSDLGPGELVYVVPITHSGPTQGDQTKIAIPKSSSSGSDSTRNNPGSTSANTTLSFGGPGPQTHENFARPVGAGPPNLPLRFPTAEVLCENTARA